MVTTRAVLQAEVGRLSVSFWPKAGHLTYEVSRSSPPRNEPPIYGSKKLLAKAIPKVAEAIVKSQAQKNPVDANLRGFRRWRPKPESNRRGRICKPRENIIDFRQLQEFFAGFGYWLHAKKPNLDPSKFWMRNSFEAYKKLKMTTLEI